MGDSTQNIATSDCIQACLALGYKFGYLQRFIQLFKARVVVRTNFDCLSWKSNFKLLLIKFFLER